MSIPWRGCSDQSSFPFTSSDTEPGFNKLLKLETLLYKWIMRRVEIQATDHIALALTWQQGSTLPMKNALQISRS